MRRVLLAVATLALILPAVAPAHVTVLPPYLEDGRQTTLVFTAPNERAPHSVVALTVTMPDGIELSAAPAPPGWTLGLTSGSAKWSGGRTRPRQIGQFRVGATATSAPGSVTIRAVQRYSDGATVRWEIPLTVVPGTAAPKEHLGPALVAGIVGLAAIGAALAWLELRRRSRATR